MPSKRNGGTPGPWEVSPAIKPGDGYNIPRTICRFEGNAARTEGRFHAIASICGDWGGPADWNANAALIAAAPELLAALDGLLDMVTDNRTHGTEVYAAAAAIARARGLA